MIKMIKEIVSALLARSYKGYFSFSSYDGDTSIQDFKKLLMFSSKEKQPTIIVKNPPLCVTKLCT